MLISSLPIITYIKDAGMFINYNKNINHRLIAASLQLWCTASHGNESKYDSAPSH